MRIQYKLGKAFTVVELLVAISVMVVLAGILFSAFSQNENAPRLETAQMILSQAFDNARSQAILKQNRARLIVYSNEPTNQDESDKFLRYFGVVVETAPDSGIWETALKGDYFPEGIYFIPESGLSTVDWDEERPQSFNQGRTMNVAFPSLDAELEGSGPEWNYFEFKSTGRLTTTFYRIILAQGNAETLKPSFSNTSALVGMVINSYGLQLPLDEEDVL